MIVQIECHEYNLEAIRAMLRRAYIDDTPLSLAAKELMVHLIDDIYIQVRSAGTATVHTTG